MRIALVTHYYPAHRGGIEIVAAEIAKRLAAAHGAEIIWHASDCDPAPTIPGVRCIPARSCNAVERRAGFPYPLWSPEALRQLARTVRGADAVHLHDCLYFPNVAAYAAARRAARPVVVTQHVGMVPYRNPLLRGLLFAAHRTLARTVLGGARQVIFVSESVRRYFESFTRFSSPPRVLVNGVDRAIFRPAKAAERERLRAELGLGGTTPLLLFVGRFVEKKGLPLLRQLAARVSHARWMFAGWGPLDPERWGLGNVRVIRGHSGAQLAPLYKAADLLVLPSTGEGFPLVVQEAMACGTPALIGSETAAGCPGAGALLLSEDTAGDAASRWERRIRDLTQAPEPLRALRPRVASYASVNWSWDLCAQRYAEVFRQ